MLLTVYNITMSSGNPFTSNESYGTTYLLPGGAGTQTTQTANSNPQPFLGGPKAEPLIREVLDVGTTNPNSTTPVNGAATPAPLGAFVALNYGQAPATVVAGNLGSNPNTPINAQNGVTGAAFWSIPFAASQPYVSGQFGVVYKAASTLAIDDAPLGSGVGGVEVVIEGPALALCVTPTAGGAIAVGTLLTSDGNGNLQPFQPPTGAAPTPTAVVTGATGTSYSYKVAPISAAGVVGSLGTAVVVSAAATLTTAAYITLTWVPVADAAYYIVQRSASSGTPSTTGTIGIVLGTITTFVDTGLAVLPNTSTTVFFPTLAAAATPTVVQVTGATAGTTTWTYTVAAITANGVWGPAGSGGSVTVGNATLSTINANKITWTATGGAASYAIQRSAANGTPSTTGFIGYASPSQATNGFIDYGIPAVTYTQNTTPIPNPPSGTAVARSLGTLVVSTTVPTLVPVVVGKF
jgi:hypothetical protein